MYVSNTENNPLYVVNSSSGDAPVEIKGHENNNYIEPNEDGSIKVAVVNSQESIPVVCYYNYGAGTSEQRKTELVQVPLNYLFDSNLNRLTATSLKDFVHFITPRIVYRLNTDENSHLSEYYCWYRYCMDTIYYALCISFSRSRDADYEGRYNYSIEGGYKIGSQLHLQHITNILDNVAG